MNQKSFFIPYRVFCKLAYCFLDYSFVFLLFLCFIVIYFNLIYITLIFVVSFFGGNMPVNFQASFTSVFVIICSKVEVSRTF